MPKAHNQKDPRKSPSEVRARELAKAAREKDVRNASKPTELDDPSSPMKSQEAKKGLFSIESRSPLLLVNNVKQLITYLFDAHGGATLTVTQTMILHTVETNPGISQTGICNITLMDRSTVAEVTKRMVKKGYLERSRMEFDERTYAVSITFEGQSELAPNYKIIRSIEDNLSKYEGYAEAMKWCQSVLIGNMAVQLPERGSDKDTTKEEKDKGPKYRFHAGSTAGAE